MPDARPAEEKPNLQLNNPFENIKHLAELELRQKIACSSFSSEQLREFYQAFWLAFEKADQMMGMLRYFRPLEKGKTQTAPGEVSIHSSVYRVLHTLQYEMPMSRVTILKILPHDLPAVPVLQAHLELLLFELICVSKQAIGDKPGIVTIEAGLKLYLSPENKGSRRFALRVSHTGPTIPQDDLSYAFDPFSCTGPVPEAQMGLYLAKKVADFYGASVHIETASRGTSFHFEFPVVPVA